MKKLREVIGYLLGGVLFVGLIPSVMWLASGMPALNLITVSRAILADILIFIGLALCVWTIIYMKRKGKGNPMDAFGHEVAPRTKHLMTDGPYHFNRNPMLTGTLVYLSGVAVWLWQWQAWCVLIIFFIIMMFQMRSEERRLHHDFGEEYEAYCRRTRRF